MIWLLTTAIKTVFWLYIQLFLLIRKIKINITYITNIAQPIAIVA